MCNILWDVPVILSISFRGTPTLKISALTYNLPRKAAEVGSSFLKPRTPTSIRSPSVTAFNTGWVFKPVGLIIQRDNQSIIRSKALLLPWSACHSSIAWWAHKGAEVSWEIRGLCREVLPPLSVNLYTSALSVSDGQWERGGKGGLFLQKERHLPQPHPARRQTRKWVVTPVSHVQTTFCLGVTCEWKLQSLSSNSVW